MAREFTTPHLAETDRPADDEASRRLSQLDMAALYVQRQAISLDDQRVLFAMLGLSGGYEYRTGPVSPEYASTSRGQRRAS